MMTFDNAELGRISIPMAPLLVLDVLQRPSERYGREHNP